MQISSGVSFPSIDAVNTSAGVPFANSTSTGEAANSPLGKNPAPISVLQPDPSASQANKRQYEEDSSNSGLGPSSKSDSRDDSNLIKRQLEQDEVLIRELQRRDIEVRNHERAHQAVGGELASAPTYSFTRGPDGQRYAVSGEVKIDVAEVPGDPAATYEKMARVRRAALAPAEPSTQDRQVAAMAAQKMTEAQTELAQQQREEFQAEAELRSQKRDDMKSEIEMARETSELAQTRQNESGEDDNTAFVSVAERFAEYNARLRQINETLLRISIPPMAPPGALLDEEA